MLRSDYEAGWAGAASTFFFPHQAEVMTMDRAFTVPPTRRPPFSAIAALSRTFSSQSLLVVLGRKPLLANFSRQTSGLPEGLHPLFALMFILFYPLEDPRRTSPPKSHFESITTCFFSGFPCDCLPNTLLRPFSRTPPNLFFTQPTSFFFNTFPCSFQNAPQIVTNQRG